MNIKMWDTQKIRVMWQPEGDVEALGDHSSEFELCPLDISMSIHVDREVLKKTQEIAWLS